MSSIAYTKVSKFITLFVTFLRRMYAILSSKELVSSCPLQVSQKTR